MIKPKTEKISQPDPLYVIFEQHLCNFDDSNIDRKAFITNIVGEYLAFLRRNSVIVPPQMERAVIDELSEQVKTMLFKKIYGFPSVQAYQQGLKRSQKSKARSRYRRAGLAKK
jgi:hypothetical protein